MATGSIDEKPQEYGGVEAGVRDDEEMEEIRAEKGRKEGNYATSSRHSGPLRWWETVTRAQKRILAKLLKMENVCRGVIVCREPRISNAQVMGRNGD